jgi:succinoglycan biosynthesis transport protein ExoP
MEPNQIKINRPLGHPVSAGAQSAMALTPKDIAVIFRRHILLIIITSFIGLVVGGASYFIINMFWPSYTAKTALKILPPLEKSPLEVGSGSTANKDIMFGYRQNIANLIKQQGTLMDLLSRDKIKNTKWYQRCGDNIDERNKEGYKELDDHFGASAIRDGDFVILSMTCDSAKESALIVNEMIDMFVSGQGSKERGDVSARRQQLNDQLVNVKREFDAAEKTLQDIRDAYGIVDLEVHNYRDTFSTKLDAIEIDHDRLTQDIESTKSQVANFKRQAEGPITEQIESVVERDQTMVLLMNQIVSYESELAARLTKFGENHREVKRIRELINETKVKREQRKAEIGEQTRRANFQNAMDAVNVLEGKLAELIKRKDEATKAKLKIDTARVQYEQRLAIRDERKKMLDDIKASIEQLQALINDPRTPKIQITNYAPEPLEASFPLPQIFLPAGFILGLLVGVGLAFLIELMNDLVRTPKDVDKYVHIPIIGVIPDSEEEDILEKVNLYNVIRQSPYSVLGESYRRFRTNLSLNNNPDLKTILVTSPMAGDGKTSVAANLAMSLVADGRKVLLIDANFWKPAVDKMSIQIEGTSQFGLGSLLEAGVDADMMINHTELEKLDIVFTGSLPYNAAELLTSVKMQVLIYNFRKKYDYVIIDGPPVLLVSAVKALAKYVDGSLLVFNANSTRRGVAARTIRELKEVNANVIGCALFAVQALTGGYFRELSESYKEYQNVQESKPVKV